MDAKRGLRLIDLLLVGAFAVDLLAPFLIWKGILPGPVRWLGDAAVAAVLGLLFLRMLVYDRVPGAMWVVLGIAAIGVTVALFRGQGLTATAWGMWLLFRFPLVGLYAYLQPWWPPRFAQGVRVTCVAILTVEVLFQIGQYLTGEPPGDNLAGTFGPHGVAPLLVFTLLVLCLALGNWLASGRWLSLVWVLLLGAVASVLGEMKFFIVAATLLSMVAVVVFVFRGKERWRVVPYGLVVAVLVLGFVKAYDAVVVPAREVESLESYLDVLTVSQYLDSSKTSVDEGVYYSTFGRNYAFRHGWNSIRQDPLTLLFGLGIGARGESVTLGTAGTALQQGRLGAWTGTSFLVMLQELGLVGMTVLFGFVLWTATRLYLDIRRNPASEAAELRYALLLFSLLWPLWLWYTQVWGHAVPMLLYWLALGYVFSEPRRQQIVAGDSHLSRLSIQNMPR